MDFGGTGAGTSKIKNITRRLFLINVAKVIVFAGILGRLAQLQMAQGTKYSYLSDQNRFREWKIIPPRGIIEDYFGKKLADNDQVFQLHLIPEDIQDENQLYFRLKTIIGLSNRQIAKIRKKQKQQKPWETVIVSDNLSWPEFSRLNLLLHELDGVKPVVSLARLYPPKESVAHVVGYVSMASKQDLVASKELRSLHVPGMRVGKTGLEKSLNIPLIGEPGYQRFEVNAYGKRVKEIKLDQGVSGKKVRTTLDLDLQNHAQEILKEKSGAICVMDIYTGGIIVMASSPTFDPNKFVHGIDSKSWKALIQNKNKPLMNKALSALYPPGSTIKPIVALSALENDIVNPKFKIFCTGSIELYGEKYHCWKKKGHGTVNLKEAIKQSCDCYFYEVARRLGVDRLSVTAKNFGLGSKLLANYQEEKSGLVPNTKWKLKNIGRGWVLGETLITGIGQGYFQCTPFQICHMTAQLANGGFKLKPKIIEDGFSIESFVENWKIQQENVEEKGYQNIEEFAGTATALTLFRNQENIKFVQLAMYAATNEPMGTSYRSRIDNKKYRYAGKTGTSQTKKITAKQRELELKQSQLPYEERDHALFTAFAPFDNPRYALSVVIEHGGSGSSGAAPLAKQLIKKLVDKNEERMKLKTNINVTI